MAFDDVLIGVVVFLSVPSMAHIDPDERWRQASYAFIQLRQEVKELRQQFRSEIDRVDQSLRGLWRLTRRLETVVSRMETPPSSLGYPAPTSRAGSRPIYATASSSSSTLTSSSVVPPLMPPGFLPTSRRPSCPPRNVGPHPSVARPPIPVAPSFPAECTGFRIQLPPDYLEGDSSASEEETPFPSCDKRCRDCWRFHERGPCQVTTSS
jgi:hypothetical protein